MFCFISIRFQKHIAVVISLCSNFLLGQRSSSFTLFDRLQTGQNFPLTLLRMKMRSGVVLSPSFGCILQTRKIATWQLLFDELTWKGSHPSPGTWSTHIQYSSTETFNYSRPKKVISKVVVECQNFLTSRVCDINAEDSVSSCAPVFPSVKVGKSLIISVDFMDSMPMCMCVKKRIQACTRLEVRTIVLRSRVECKLARFFLMASRLLSKPLRNIPSMARQIWSRCIIYFIGCGKRLILQIVCRHRAAPEYWLYLFRMKH